MSQQEANWDLDSDEIASIASEELHENRPNRWTGPKSSWRHLTEEERMLWRSMKQLQDENLGVHLYNAFALRRRAADPETAQDMIIQTEDGQEAIWAPPKLWTAWPIHQKQLPPEGLFKDEGDEDDAFTFRRNENSMPSNELRDELSATILRIAKARVSRRLQPESVRPSIEAPTSPVLGNEDESSSDSSNTDSSSYEARKQAVAVKILDDPQPSTRDDKTYEPVVSADDDLSATLLQPSVRHILAQLDKTLTILHNTRVAGLSYLSDSSETETEEESENNEGTPKKRGRGRPRLPPKPSAAASPSGSMSRRGRPKIEREPEGGETKEQMELRLARQNHRRLPATEKDREDAFEEWLRQGDERVSREQRMLSSRPVSEEPDSVDGISGVDEDETAAKSNVEKKIRRWGLRDWSDVIGAAALAGFPEQVIQRATQRCANLFGQGMKLTRLEEVPVVRSGASTRTTLYRPERIRLSSSPSESDNDDADDEGDQDASLQQRRMASRQVSLAASSREASAETPRRGRPSAERVSSDPMGYSPRPRSSSLSRSRSSAGILYCPLASCSRAATGFARGANLRRHMRLVHPGHDEDAVVVEDSEDETLGAVHVDGFLRTINPGKGWRGEDTQMRKRRRDAQHATPPTETPNKRVDVAYTSGDSD